MKTIQAMAVIVAATVLLLAGVANAHSFNVALLIGAADPAAADGSAVRDGFLLATRERDGHSGQESDGHLGGLDVYLFVIDGGDDPVAAARAALDQQSIDILAATDTIAPIAALRALTAGSRTVLMAPGTVPFPVEAASGGAARTAAVQRFIDAFAADYGDAPTAAAARGYNAARRIDTAVRAQGGVSDTIRLEQALRDSERRFDW